MKKIYLLLSAAAILLSAKSYAWGAEGHHIVAEIASKYLSENAKNRIEQYLGTTGFDDAAVWMDEMRQNHDYDFMKPWHYVNIDKGSNYTPTTDENVINQITEKQRELKHAKTLCTEQVKTDLEILFHLIGDLHQPLHTGYGADRGGNTVEINFMGDATNLHWVWDSKIIDQQKISLNDCLQLMKTLSPEQIDAVKKNDVVAWMTESRSYLDTVYAFSGHVLGEEYAKKNRHIIEKQLLYAGLRLAAVLENCFGEEDKKSKIQVNSTPLQNNVIGIDEAAKHIGEVVTVCGKAFGGKYFSTKGKTTLINMGAPYPNSTFTLVIFGNDRENFTYKPEEYLTAKSICVTGMIKLYKDRPEIIVSRESQIVVK